MSKLSEFINSKRRQVETEDTSALVKSPVARFFGLTALTLIILGTLFPLYWMLRTAFSTNKSMFSDATSLAPVDFTLGAIKRVLGLATTQEAIAEGGSGGQISFLHYMGNSLIVCTLIVVFQIGFGAMAAYAFAILQWRGRDTVFAIFLVSLMVPGIFTLLPNFLLVKELGLLNTYLGIALPAMFMAPFSVFFLRQFFLGINRSLIEAATIDGGEVDTAFLHTNKFYLLDKDRVIRGWYDGTDTVAMAKLARDIGLLFLEKDKKKKRNLFRK